MTPPGNARSEMENERFMILQMIQDGTVSTDEGIRLLEAMDRLERIEARTTAAPEPPKPTNPARSVHILVTNAKGQQEIDLNLPIALVDMGLTIASKFAGDRLADIPNIRTIAQSGFTGKLLDINHGSDRIEITLE